MSDLMARLDHASRDRARRKRRQQPKRPPRRDIQGLRAVAVLAVIFNHLFDWPTGAFVGVDVFFVISGFLITGLLVRDYEGTGTISARRFYQRRVKRIVPAASLVLVVTVCASFVLLSAARVKTIGLDAISAFFFVSNWRFAEVGTDYFQQGLPPSPLQHYWSLSIEEQFYFVWPWLMLLVLVVGTRLFRWERRHGRLVAGILMAAIIAVSFAWSLQQSSTDPNYAYFSTFTRVWELGAGALLAIAEPKLRLRNIWHRTFLGWVGIAGIVASLFVVSSSHGFPAPWAVLPVAATGLVILAGCGGEQPYLQPLTSSIAQYVGNISYSLYLWHFPVIILLAAVVQTDTAEYYTVAILLIASLSIVSFHLVENPARDAVWIEKRQLVEGWKYVGVTALAIVCVTLIAFTLSPDRYAAPATSPFAIQGAGVDPGSEDAPTCVGAAVMAPGSACQLNQGPSFYPPVSRMLSDSQGAYDCFIEAGKPMKSCGYGLPAGPDVINVALTGDSHAATLLPALKDQAKNLNIRIDTYVGEGCGWRTGTDEKCAARADIAAALLAGNYDVIITQGARQFSGDQTDVFTDAWAPAIEGGAKVVVVADNPGVAESTLECVRRVGFSPVDDDCATPRKDATSDADVLVEAATGTRGAKVVDMVDYFCDDETCPAVIGNVMVYRDEVAHITGTYSRSLAPYLAKKLKPLLR